MSTWNKRGYTVHGGDPAGPRDFGTYGTFEEALWTVMQHKMLTRRGKATGMVMGIWGPDADDCGNDLTEKQEEALEQVL